MVVQSWDTAYSADPRADYSVCTTWGFRDGKWSLLDLFRDRLDYPDLLRKTRGLADHWSADKVLIEKAGSGRSLLQDCFRADRRRFRAITPCQDKEIRFAQACAPIEAGTLLLPREAPWLAAFRRELQSFPRGRHDDQVDSVSQFINWSSSDDGFWRALPNDHPLKIARRQRRNIRRR